MVTSLCKPGLDHYAGDPSVCPWVGASEKSALTQQASASSWQTAALAPGAQLLTPPVSSGCGELNSPSTPCAGCLALIIPCACPLLVQLQGSAVTSASTASTSRSFELLGKK